MALQRKYKTYPPSQRIGARVERKAKMPFLSTAARRAQDEHGGALAFDDSVQGLRIPGVDE